MNMRVWILPLVLLGACTISDEYDDDASGPCTSLPCPRLSDYGLFTGDGHTQEPAAGVVPYVPISPLYSDGASKHRFIKLPPGGKITYSDVDMWQFPVGTMLIKTFGYLEDERDPQVGEQLIETRVLVRGEERWDAYVYVWNAAQTDAVLDNLGSHTAVDVIGPDGAPKHVEYNIPDKNACGDCHQPGTRMQPIGPRTRQLNSVVDGQNQVDRMNDLGMFDVSPAAVADRPTLTDYHDESQPVEARARAYMEANCAHCHNDHGGRAASSGLNLMIENQTAGTLGFCKRPFSAGGLPAEYVYDVVPGHPEQSILVYRIDSNDPEVKMPELPLTTIDPLGVQLTTQWIAGLPEDLCLP